MFFGQLSQRVTCNPCERPRGRVQFQSYNFVTLALPLPGGAVRETDLDALLTDFTAPELVEDLNTLHPAGHPTCSVSLVSNARMHVRKATITLLTSMLLSSCVEIKGTSAYKRFEFWTLPPYLMFQLSRFRAGGQLGNARFVGAKVSAVNYITHVVALH